MEQTDNELIHASIRGDADAFAVLMNRYMQAVYSFAYRLVRNPDGAQDVTQETFIKVWKHRARFDASHSFKTWLFTIARNTAYDALKKKSAIPFSQWEEYQETQQQYESPRAAESVIADQAPLPDELADARLQKEYIEKAIARLPLLYQTVVLLRYDSDLTFEEIGAVLDIPPNTAKSQYRRAVVKLRDYVSDLIQSNKNTHPNAYVRRTHII